MELNKNNLNNNLNINNIKIKRPYGETDPYAIVELVAITQMQGSKYNTDQMPALSARVSHAASGKTGENVERDLGLMNYLAQNFHMTPFEHQSATFKIVTPLIVARQWMRHRTQSYNEVSMRYSADPVGKFYMPDVWRLQASTNKQASLGQVADQEVCTKILSDAYNNSLNAYNKLLSMGVCREQARLIVPVGNYTEFYATANLRNWFAFYKLRIAQDAQWEIRQYAQSIGEILESIWPNSWSALKNSNK
ncbi:MAG: Thymidylate synthase ThyX [candidate division TM6 bacterium GW2011_GWF2_28_16]|nr:MAG: Thymidylate synthase ThyX [candidate division TM6 bacterium GW2011_GWF2_28_16]